MRARFNLFLSFCAMFGTAFSAHAAVKPFSQYGQIQNVQNYSTSPYWSPDGPYNQRVMPQPVYATGTDVSTADCASVVNVLIANACAANNNCIGKQLSDIRPTVMVQLSRMPGHNYATACAGFIDTAFNEYVSKYANAAPNGVPVAFPSASGNAAVTAAAAESASGIQMKNPYERTTPQWAKDVAARSAELKELQAQNGYGTVTIEKTDFPKTTADLTIQERTANKAAGYEPFKDLKAYQEIKIENQETYLERMKERAEQQRELDRLKLDDKEFCKKYPNDQSCKKPDNNNNNTNNTNNTNDTTATTAPDNQNDTGTSSSDTGELSNAELIELIIKALGPDTKEQEKFFQALATSYVSANKKDETTHLDDAFVIGFLGDNDPELTKYKTPLSQLTGTVTEQQLGIDIDWDAILEEISEVLDQASPKYGALVCENNRSYEGLIDAVGWITTAVAAVATFYAGGAGGAAVTAGRAALGAGLKASAKALAKVGGKAAAKRASAQGGKQLAKSAVKLGLKTNMRGWNNYAGKGVLRAGVKNYAKVAGKNLKNKWTALAATGALIYQGSNAGLGYSLLSSDADKEIVNCQDVDHNEGCYTVCGDSPTGWKGKLDMLNSVVLQPITGKKYCVNESDYHLYEITTNNSMGKKLILNADQLAQMRSKIKQIQDKEPCDWNEDDIDMYIGSFVHDPDTLDVTTEAMMIQDIIRIDD